MGNSWKIRVILAGLFVQVHLGIDSQSRDKNILLFLVRREPLSHGKFYHLLQVEMGDHIALLPAVSQVPLALSNQYEKVTYLEMAYPEPLCLLRPKRNLVSAFQSLHRARESAVKVITKNKAGSLLLVLGMVLTVYSTDIEHRGQGDSPLSPSGF